MFGFSPVSFWEDHNQEYNKLELADESRYITTFATHLGIQLQVPILWGQLGDIFQERMHQTLAFIKDGISDDTLSFEACQEVHDTSF